MLETLGYDSLYELDYESFSIAGEKVFDMDNMLGTPSAKVMARMIQDGMKLENEDKNEIKKNESNENNSNFLVCENEDG